MTTKARSGETGTGSTEGESPSGKAGAPKLDWTAPLMLDDGKGTGVELAAVECVVPKYGIASYEADGTHRYGHIPRIINRPKPDAEPVEQLPADEVDQSELEMLRHENDCLQARIAQLDYPCSPHCDGYLRELKLRRDLRETDPDTVTVPRMTEQEFNHRFMLRGLTPIAVAVELGLIRPDTPLDRFTASHPNWRDLPVEEAVRLALEWGR